MARRTRHRRRFHTDRIVAARRARYLRESREHRADAERYAGHRLSYGALASTDPWDCGRAACGVCHGEPVYRRAAERRAWRNDWGLRYGS